MVVEFKNQQAQRFLLGEFRLEPDKRLLTRNGEVIRLGNKPLQVLLYLIENRHRVVPRSELLDTFWDGKDVYDDTLRKSVGAIRKALDEDYASPYFIETHYGGGYRYIGPLEDRSFEEEDAAIAEVEKTRIVKIITEEEDSLAPAIPDTRTILPHSRAQLSNPTRQRFLTLVVIALVAAIALGTLVIVLTSRKNAPTATQPTFPIRSIAVLPLKNISNDSENEYFTDGLTETFINELSKIKGLKVISRTSIFTYKGKEIDPREVGHRLGVEAILEGSVRKSGDTVRVETRLMSTEDGRVIWTGNTFDRTLKDIFAVQDEIACSLVASLRMAGCGEAGGVQFGKHYTENVEAYEGLLKALYFYGKRSPVGLQKAIEHAEQAITLDSQYVPAYAALAGCYMMSVWYTPRDPKDALARAKQAANRALEIDDTYADTHAVLASIHGYERDWSQSRKEWQRVFELNPAYQDYGYAYFLLRDNPDEAVRWIKRAQELDPLSILIRTNVGQILYYTRRYDEAIGQLQAVLELDPNYAMAHTYLGQVYIEKGRYTEAIEALQKSITLYEQSPEILASLGYAYAAAGRRDEAQKVLDELSAISKRAYVSPYMVAHIYAGLKENTRAFEMLEKAYEQRDSHIVDLSYDPVLDTLRTDPRYTNLQRRIGL
jgi:TolB-like protein/DNA-binding winged helix-turn-helix (wHTH) protein/lipopolysaccharide biosynthesis regulator YciM